MQVDSTNITVDKKEEDPFKDLGPSITGNIVGYSSSIDDEGEDELKKKDEEQSRKEEVTIVEEKLEAYKLKDTWKSVMHESMFMP